MTAGVIKGWRWLTPDTAPQAHILASCVRCLVKTSIDPFLLGLDVVGVQLVTGGNRAVVDAVAQGEVAFGATDADDVAAAQAARPTGGFPSAPAR